MGPKPKQKETRSRLITNTNLPYQQYERNVHSLEILFIE